jgi:hypothetical protein
VQCAYWGDQRAAAGHESLMGVSDPRNNSAGLPFDVANAITLSNRLAIVDFARSQRSSGLCVESTAKGPRMHTTAPLKTRTARAIRRTAHGDEPAETFTVIECKDIFTDAEKEANQRHGRAMAQERLAALDPSSIEAQILRGEFTLDLEPLPPT